jgi:hypothetical protein
LFVILSAAKDLLSVFWLVISTEAKRSEAKWRDLRLLLPLPALPINILRSVISTEAKRSEAKWRDLRLLLPLLVLRRHPDPERSEAPPNLSLLSTASPQTP